MGKIPEMNEESLDFDIASFSLVATGISMPM